MLEKHRSGDMGISEVPDIVYPSGCCTPETAKGLPLWCIHRHGIEFPLEVTSKGAAGSVPVRQTSFGRAGCSVLDW